MNFLFFFVHPSKYHAFKHTINTLKSKNHHVDIIITSKDVLEPLVKQEGWEYINIFPKGRKMRGIPSFISAGINFWVTIFRLYNNSKSKNYDLFITDDLLSIVGKIKKVPTIIFQDSDIDVQPESTLIIHWATTILSPSCTNMGKYSYKKISYESYKELAYLHPNRFKPDKTIIEKFNPNLTKYFIIRLVSLRATHDFGKKGINNDNLNKLIALLENEGLVFITAERELPKDLEKYRLKIPVQDITNALFFAELYIGDSQTMTSEAAILGTPAIRFNDFVGKLSVMEEKQTKYRLSYGFKTNQFDKLYDKVKELLKISNLKEEFKKRRDRMLNEKIDLSSFLIWFFENYPGSKLQMKQNPDTQYRFK